jgi:AcrR family transcriptional regulator
MTDAGAKPPLSRERIVAQAVSLADASGLSAVTMRAVADALDYEAMSLYHHVKDKRALLAGMVESAVGEVVENASRIADRDAWTSTIRARCLAARDVMLTHPWAPTLITAQTESPPALMALYEQFIATLIRAGFTYELAHRAIHVMGSFVLGFSNELFEPEPGEEIDADAMMAMAEAMPHVLQMAQSAMHEHEGSLSTCDTQAEFEFTLDVMLEGLELRRAALASERTA